MNGPIYYKNYAKQNDIEPVVEDTGEGIETSVSDFMRACVAAVYDPVQEGLSIWIKF